MLLPQSTFIFSEGVANFDPHEDKVDVITPVNILFGGCQILTPHEDKVDVITPVNISFRGGGEFSCDDDRDVMTSWCDDDDGDDDDDHDDHDHDDCKCGAMSGLGRTLFKCMCVIHSMWYVCSDNKSGDLFQQGLDLECV